MLDFRRRSWLALALALALAGCSSASTETGLLHGSKTSSGQHTRPTAPFARSGFPRPTHAHDAVVTHVSDGDTITLSAIGKTRLIGIDTPEVFGQTECYGRAASSFTKRTLRVGTHVKYRLGVEDRDRFGRALAYVWLADGRMFNGVL